MTDGMIVQKFEPRELTAETTKFTAYLSQLGLPTDNVIATTEERDVIAANLPAILLFVQDLPHREGHDHLAGLFRFSLPEPPPHAW